MVTIAAILATCAIALCAANADAYGGLKTTGASCSYSSECAGYCDNSGTCYPCSICLGHRDAIEGMYCPSGCSAYPRTTSRPYPSARTSRPVDVHERSNIYTATVTICMYTGTSHCSGSGNRTVCNAEKASLSDPADGIHITWPDTDVGSCSSGCLDIVFSGQDCDSVEDAMNTNTDEDDDGDERTTVDCSSSGDCSKHHGHTSSPAISLDGSCKTRSDVASIRSFKYECTDNRTGVIVGIVIGALCFLGELLAMLPTPRPTTWKQPPPRAPALRTRVLLGPI